MTLVHLRCPRRRPQQSAFKRWHACKPRRFRWRVSSPWHRLEVRRGQRHRPMRGRYSPAAEEARGLVPVPLLSGVPRLGGASPRLSLQQALCHGARPRAGGSLRLPARYRGGRRIWPDSGTPRFPFLLPSKGLDTAARTHSIRRTGPDPCSLLSGGQAHITYSLDRDTTFWTQEDTPVWTLHTSRTGLGCMIHCLHSHPTPCTVARFTTLAGRLAVPCLLPPLPFAALRPKRDHTLSRLSRALSLSLSLLPGRD